MKIYENFKKSLDEHNYDTFKKMPTNFQNKIPVQSTEMSNNLNEPQNPLENKTHRTLRSLRSKMD